MELVVTEGIDIWKVASGGQVDFRVTNSRWQEMKEEMAGCDEAGTVEKVLKHAERMASKQVTINRTQAEWFDEYVSCLFI